MLFGRNNTKIKLQEVRKFQYVSIVIIHIGINKQHYPMFWFIMINHKYLCFT